MKRVGFFLLSFVLLFLVGSLDVYGADYIVQNGVYTVKKDNTENLNSNTFKGEKVSAPRYNTTDGRRAYCIHPEAKGPSANGTKYTCDTIADAAYACAIKKGKEGKNTQQEIQYALKMISTYKKESKGNIKNSNANFKAIIESIAKGDFNTLAKGDLIDAVPLYNACKDVTDQEQKYYGTSSSGLSYIGYQVEQVKFDCSSDTCTFYGKVKNYKNGGKLTLITYTDLVKDPSRTTSTYLYSQALSLNPIDANGNFKIEGLQKGNDGYARLSIDVAYEGYQNVYSYGNVPVAYRCYKNGAKDNLSSPGIDGDDTLSSGVIENQTIIIANDPSIDTDYGNKNWNGEFACNPDVDDCGPGPDTDECPPDHPDYPDCEPDNPPDDECPPDHPDYPDCDPDYDPNECKPEVSGLVACAPTSSINESNNYKRCIINENASKKGACGTHTEVKNNYCRVSCKEDIAIEFPTQANTAERNGTEVAKNDISILSGRYFRLNTDTMIRGTKTCVATAPEQSTNKGDTVEGIDYEQFLIDVCGGTTDCNGGWNAELKTAYENWQAYKEVENEKGQAIAKANREKYEELKSKIETAISDINSCSAFDMSYDFNPTVEFEYDEDYEVSYTGYEQYTPAEVTENYCLSEASAVGFDCSGKTSSNTVELKNVLICSEDDKCKEEAVKVPKNIAVKKTITQAMKWSNTAQYFTLYGSGSITNTEVEGKSTKLPENIYPISIQTLEGTYEFRIKVSNLGEDAKFDSCIEELKVGNDPQLACPYEVENFLNVVHPCYETTNSGYVIIFDENGDQVMVRKDSKEAIKACCDENGENCNYTPDKDIGVNYFVRSVSLDNLFPTDRSIGSNWSSDVGKAALEDIEGKGDSIYAEEPEYSFTLTASQRSKIRDYNEQQEKEDKGYADFNQTCDMSGNCTSDFLEEYNGEYFTNNLE